MAFEYQEHQKFKAKKRSFFTALGIFYIVVFALIIGNYITRTDTDIPDNVFSATFKHKNVGEDYMIRHIELNRHKFIDVDINSLAISLKEAVSYYYIPSITCKAVADTVIRFNFPRRTPEYDNAYTKLISGCI